MWIDQFKQYAAPRELPVGVRGDDEGRFGPPTPAQGDPTGESGCSVAVPSLDGRGRGARSSGAPRSAGQSRQMAIALGRLEPGAWGQEDMLVHNTPETPRPTESAGSPPGVMRWPLSIIACHVIGRKLLLKYGLAGTHASKQGRSTTYSVETLWSQTRPRVSFTRHSLIPPDRHSLLLAE